jgi:nitrate reductase assembly molybdenum cofactor insertion protein NarJ
MKPQKLEDLLADYSDALLAGKAIDREELIASYGGDRQELAELLAIIDTLDRGRPRPRKEFVERMRELIKQHRQR